MTKKKTEVVLPQGVSAIGLSEEQVATSWGVSLGTFQEIKTDHPDIVPRARRLRNLKRYSRIESEDAFHKLPYWDETGPKPDNEWSIT